MSVRARLVTRHLHDVILLVIEAPTAVDGRGRRVSSSLRAHGLQVTLSLAPRRGTSGGARALVLASGSAARANAAAAHTPMGAARAVPSSRLRLGWDERSPGCGGASAASGYAGGIFDSTGNLEPSYHAYSSTLYTYFDSLTPENEMKMDFLEPRPDQFNFMTADRLVNAMAPLAASHLKVEVTEADVEMEPNVPSYAARSTQAEQQDNSSTTSPARSR